MIEPKFKIKNKLTLDLCQCVLGNVFLNRNTSSTLKKICMSDFSKPVVIKEACMNEVLSEEDKTFLEEGNYILFVIQDLNLTLFNSFFFFSLKARIKYGIPAPDPIITLDTKEEQLQYLYFLINEYVKKPLAFSELTTEIQELLNPLLMLNPFSCLYHNDPKNIFSRVILIPNLGLEL